MGACWVIGHGPFCRWWWGNHSLGFLQLPVVLLNVQTFFNKVVDEFYCLLVLHLFTSDPSCVQKLLPISIDVANL